MRKSLKKIVSFGLIVGMVAATMVGCGTKESESSKSGDNVFKIGGIGPLTGNAASYGISVKNGAQIAIDEINAAGGVKVGDSTYKLEMKFEDDEASPDIAPTAYNNVMDWGAQAILGCVTSGACKSITALTLKDGILQITPSGSDPGCIENDNAFRVCFSDPFQGMTMANLAKELGYTKIAIIYNNSDDYSTGGMKAFTEQAEANGQEVVACEAFAEGANDFNTQLTKIKATDAEAIFVPAYYGDCAFITTQAAALGMDLPFLGMDGWDGVIAQVTDKSVIEGAIFLSPFVASLQEDAVQKFVEAYKKANKDAIPDQFAADGYDTVYVMKAAMEKAESVESAKLIEAMNGLQVTGLTGAMTFSADGDANKGAKFIEIKDGEYVLR